MEEQEYIGDGVYASFNGYAVILKTQRGFEEHWIALELEHIENLNNYLKRMREKQQQQTNL